MGTVGIPTGTETIVIWATLYNFLVSSGLAPAWSCIYHFQLIMYCSSAYPTLWLGGYNNTQFMIGSSNCIVTWWLIVKHSVSTMAQLQVRTISQRENGCLKIVINPCSIILWLITTHSFHLCHHAYCSYRGAKFSSQYSCQGMYIYL